MRGCHRLEGFWGVIFFLYAWFFQLIQELALFLGVMWLFSQSLCGEVCVSAVPLPLLCWSLSAREVHSLETSQPEPWWARQGPGMTSSDSHTRRQGRGEGSSWNPLCYSWPLSSIHSIFSPLGSHWAAEMHHCRRRGLAGNTFPWGWGTGATSCLLVSTTQTLSAA